MSRTIEKYSPEKKSAYKAYIENHADSMFFHSSAYIDLLVDLLECEIEHILCFENDEIVGVFPLLSKTGQLGKVYNSLPYYGSNGSVLSNDKEIGLQLVKAYNELISDESVASSSCVENPMSENNYEEEIKHNETDFRIGQFTNLEYTEDHQEKLMSSFHYKTRNMVRKGMKSEIEIKVDNNAIDFLMNTHIANMEAIGGKPKPKKFFDLIQKHFVAGEDYKILVAYHENEPVGALLLFYYRTTVEYYSPVIIEKHRSKQPLSLLIYEAMVEASQNNFTMWNWGGTWASQDGVYNFKKRWGTNENNYKYFIQINNKEIYNSTKENLLAFYPDFFVLPFNLLNE